MRTRIFPFQSVDFSVSRSKVLNIVSRTQVDSQVRNRIIQVSQSYLTVFDGLLSYYQRSYENKKMCTTAILPVRQR